MKKKKSTVDWLSIGKLVAILIVGIARYFLDEEEETGGTRNGKSKEAQSGRRRK